MLKLLTAAITTATTRRHVTTCTLVNKRLSRLLQQQQSTKCSYSSSSSWSSNNYHESIQNNKLKKYNMPLSADSVPEYGGIATMMRLPHVTTIEEESRLDACFVGIPIDIGTSFRSGTRHGPRAIRHESPLIGPYSRITGAAPFESLQVADVGDVPVNPYDLRKSLDNITKFYKRILNTGCIPLGFGGDHTLSLGVLRALGSKYGPVAMVHVDAHADVSDNASGEEIFHGSPFRRALEERLLDPHKVIQIGLRGGGYGPNDYEWPQQQGFRMILAKDCWHKSLVDLMKSVREQIGPEQPVYFTFDIDALDPAFCPGTGTPEIGGLTSMQALEIVRGMKGLNIVCADVVEVNPLFDHSGVTALTAANILFEMLCVLPGVKYIQKKNV